MALNCTVKCVKSEYPECFTVGSIYSIISGFVLDDNKQAWGLDDENVFVSAGIMPIETIEPLKNNDELLFIVVPGLPKHNNSVSHPSHYNQGNVECIEAFSTGNAIKYLWRWKNKGGIEDLKKAKFYIDLLIERLSKAKGV